MLVNVVLKAIYAGNGLRLLGSFFQVLGPTYDKLCIPNFNLQKGNFNFVLQKRMATPLLSTGQKTLLKVVSTTFLLVCIVCLKESICETRKNVFYFTLFLRYLNFKFSDIQMSWWHQMPKHETQNTYYWIIWEVNTVW